MYRILLLCGLSFTSVSEFEDHHHFDRNPAGGYDCTPWYDILQLFIGFTDASVHLFHKKLSHKIDVVKGEKCRQWQPNAHGFAFFFWVFHLVELDHCLPISTTFVRAMPSLWTLSSFFSEVDPCRLNFVCSSPPIWTTYSHDNQEK